MLVIREEQVAALRRACARELERALCRHARTHFARARELEDAALHDLVAKSVQRAIERGMRSERSLYRFINLVMAYGAEFDADPALAWMRQYLDDADVPDPEERLARLHTAALVRRQRGEQEADQEEQEQEEEEEEEEEEDEDEDEDEDDDGDDEEDEDDEEEETGEEEEEGEKTDEPHE
jgi:hypothetical protein